MRAYLRFLGEMLGYILIFPVILLCGYVVVPMIVALMGWPGPGQFNFGRWRKRATEERWGLNTLFLDLTTWAALWVVVGIGALFASATAYLHLRGGGTLFPALMTFPWAIGVWLNIIFNLPRLFYAVHLGLKDREKDGPTESER